jgi:chorismate mutase
VPDDLNHLRAQIDAIDSAVIRLLGERAKLVAKTWAHKASVGRPAHDETREAQIRARLLLLANEVGLDQAKVTRIIEAIIGVDLRPGPS